MEIPLEIGPPPRRSVPAAGFVPARIATADHSPRATLTSVTDAFLSVDWKMLESRARLLMIARRRE